jgi:hypothetical protein
VVDGLLGSVKSRLPEVHYYRLASYNSSAADWFWLLASCLAIRRNGLR